MSSYGQFGPGSPGGSSTRIKLNEIQDAVSINPEILEKIERMDRNFKTIMDRLAVLDDPSPERLARHKMLKEAYIKYLFLEKLCMAEDAEDDES